MITDREQRRQAVMTDGHAFVWASAGTGKTHTLTLRALFLLLMAPFEKRAKDTECARLYSAATRAERLRAARAVIRRFVLTTFTRKAAAEMQTRLFEYLDSVASAGSLEVLKARVATMNSGHGDEQFIEVAEKALEKTDGFEPLRAGTEALAELATELQVCTLHSFAAAMLRRHPIAAGIPPTAQFAEEDDATTPDVAGQVIERWWQYVLADATLRKELEKLIEVIPLADMRDWLGEVFEHRWIADEMDFGKPDEGVLREIREACEALTNHPKAMSLTDVEDLRPALTVMPFSWTVFCRVVYDKRAKLFLDRLPKDPSKAVNLKAAIASLPAAQRRYFESHVAIYPHIIAKCLVEEHAETWARWQRFVRRFAGWVEDAAVRELSIVSFDDMVRLTAKLLRTNKDVRAEERKRLWAILVDEFQDTDPVQLELLESLVRRELKGDHEVIGFFVGDAKQSIYRFRGADLPAIQSFVNRYEKAVKAADGGVHQFRLTASFRSLKAITDFVNHLFEKQVPLPDYEKEKLTPVRKDDGPTPEWRVIREDATARSADNKREFAAWETARLIEDYKKTVGNGDKAYSDIVVLVRTHEEMDALLPVLEQAGIPVVSSGAQTFYRQPEVLDALNLLIALHNPQDPLAVGALLRSPLFGLSDEQIYQLLEQVSTRELFHGTKALPASVPAEARTRIEQMRNLVAERTTLALAEWLRRVRQFIPVGVYAQQDAEGRAVVRIENVLASFCSAVGLGTIAPIAWLIEQRARADRSDDFDADLGEDVSVTDESMAAVRAMTIHKSKGLQGKCVIVYGWQTTLDKRTPGAPKKHKPISLTGRDGRMVRGYQLSWGPLLVVSPQYPKAEELNQEFEAEEAKRLAYVAATRAKDRVVMLSPHTDEITGGILTEAKPALEKNTSIVAAFENTLQVTVVESRKGETGARTTNLRICDPKAYAKLWRERAEAVAQGAEPLLYKPSQPERPEEDDAVDLPDYVRRKIEDAQQVAKEVGTLVHRYLEGNLTDESFDAAKWQRLLDSDPSTQPGSKAIEKATGALKAFFGSPNHHRVKRGRVLGRELPVYLMHDGKAWSGVMDLVLEEDGTIRGIDYKVMKKPSSLSEEYRQQERIYSESLQRLFPKRKVSFEFWWLAKD